MITKIELSGMRFYAFHGVNEQEKRVGNYFVVDLLLTAPLEKPVQSDLIGDTINYATVYALIKKEMDISSNLLEHVAGRIIHVLREEFPHITAIEIKLKKLTPPLGGEVESAAIMINEQF